jgi:hypothetical protein
VRLAVLAAHQPQLREDHRSEFPGAGQRDADGASRLFAGLEFRELIHIERFDAGGRRGCPNG